MHGQRGSSRYPWCSEYGSSKRGQGADKLFVPMDSWINSRATSVVSSPARTGAVRDWANTKPKARKAVHAIARGTRGALIRQTPTSRHAFAPDTPWQAEMEDAFGFTGRSIS